MDAEFRIKRLESENVRLKRAVEELSILNEVASAVSSTSSLDQLVNLIVQKCVKHLKVEQGAVLLFDHQAEGAALKTMVRKVQTDIEVIPYRLGDQITGWMLKNQESLIVNDFATDSRFRIPEGADKIKSLLCAPLRLKGRMIGVLNVFNKKSGEGFTDSDQRLLSIIATQSAQVVENARLAVEGKELEDLQKELQLARDIQMRLLPKEPPQIEGYEVAGQSEPALRVGGDYFDFLEFEDGRWGFCLADVSGKGITASLLMSNVQATIRGQARLAPDVGQCVERSNQMLYESTDSNKFVTMFYAVLDPKTNILDYSNAGHNPPILISADREPMLLEAGGPVLSVMPKFPYAHAEVEMRPGDTLLVYTDGYSEAMNGRFEEFGEDSMRELAATYKDLAPQKLLDTVTEKVNKFCEGTPQFDDMTIMALHRWGSDRSG